MPADLAAWAYFDTSVLVKCYVEEPGTAEAMRLISRHTVLSSTLAPIELTGALRRQEASGVLTRRCGYYRGTRDVERADRRGGGRRGLGAGQERKVLATRPSRSRTSIPW